MLFEFRVNKGSLTLEPLATQATAAIVSPDAALSGSASFAFICRIASALISIARALGP